jgi:predicted O-linked N-acetylglucosamine transferase (SPINDLY family)
LAALRGGLRERMSASSLCRPDRFARTLEAQFAQMWREHGARSQNLSKPV